MILLNQFKRIPKHIGVIPDGNRRWAQNNNMEKQEGYKHGVMPGQRLCTLMAEVGVKEATFYGFTKDNTARPKIQTEAYTNACVEAVEVMANKDANILVVGNTTSKLFPEALQPYANKRVSFGKGQLNVNYLVNYDWNWDLSCAVKKDGPVIENIGSKEISRIDLIIRWGGRRRLSGFLPIQSVYSDFYIIEEMWPDFKDEHFYEAMEWYQSCDVTLGG